jgi:hypothetical protein
VAKAKLQLDADGGIEVVVVSWNDPVTVLTIDSREMLGLIEECSLDGDSEPDYDLLCGMVCERIIESFCITGPYNEHAVAEAVNLACVPGPGGLITTIVFNI